MANKRLAVRQAIAKSAAIIFAAICVLCFSTVVMQAVDGKKLRQDGLKADGVVYYIRNGTAVPYVRFSLADGKNVEFAEYILNNGFHIGQHVPVLYRLADPAGTARVETHGSLGVDMIYIVGGWMALVAASMAAVHASSDDKLG